jgi:hypothetical protein
MKSKSKMGNFRMEGCVVEMSGSFVTSFRKLSFVEISIFPTSNQFEKEI